MCTECTNFLNMRVPMVQGFPSTRVSVAHGFSECTCPLYNGLQCTRVSVVQYSHFPSTRMSGAQDFPEYTCVHCKIQSFPVYTCVRCTVQSFPEYTCVHGTRFSPVHVCAWYKVFTSTRVSREDTFPEYTSTVGYCETRLPIQTTSTSESQQLFLLISFQTKTKMFSITYLMATVFRLLYPEHEGSAVLRNVGNYFPVYSVTFHKTWNYSSTAARISDLANTSPDGLRGAPFRVNLLVYRFNYKPLHFERCKFLQYNIQDVTYKLKSS
jgi:hypothetical protein